MLRRFSAGFAGFLLLLSLLLTPLVMSLHMTINSPEVVKNALSKSNVYDSLAGAELLPEGTDLSSTLLSDPGVASALESAIPPSHVRTSMEKIVDSVYSYVHGEIPSPDLSVDVSSVKTKFADNVAAYVKQKYDSLPPCAAFTVPVASLEGFLQATCAPRGVSSQQASEYARSEIMDTALFSDERLDVATLAGAEGDSLTSALESMRGIYPYFTMLVYILPILCMILIGGLLFLNETKRKGIKRSANSLLGAGLVNIVVAAVVLWFLEINLEDGSTAAVLDGFGNITQDLLGGLRAWWWGISGAFIITAIVIYIIPGMTRPRPNGFNK